MNAGLLLLANKFTILTLRRDNVSVLCLKLVVTHMGRNQLDIKSLLTFFFFLKLVH